MFLGMAAARAQVLIFPLGGGVCRQPGAFRTSIIPTIKITADSTLKPEFSPFDYYAGEVIEGHQSKPDASEDFLRLFLDVVSGKPTTREFSTYMRPVRWCRAPRTGRKRRPADESRQAFQDYSVSPGLLFDDYSRIDGDGAILVGEHRVEVQFLNLRVGFHEV